MVKVFKSIRNKSGELIRDFKMFHFREQRRTGLTSEEKDNTDYIYHPKDTSVLQHFIDTNR